MRSIDCPLYPNSVDHEGSRFFYRIDPSDGYVVWRKLEDSCFSLVDEQESRQLTNELHRMLADG